MIYLVHVGQTYQTKNKLQAEVLQFILSHDRMVIPEKYVASFKSQFYEGIRQLNIKHGKCNPIKISLAIRFYPNDVHLNFESHNLCSMTLLASLPEIECYNQLTPPGK